MSTEPLRVDRLTAEHLVDPLGLSEPRPRLSWRLVDPLPGSRQVGCRVFTDGWDGGRIDSPDSLDVRYTGPVRQRVTWQVEVWVDDGRSAISAPAVFEQGLTAWSGDWICRPLPTDAHDAHRPAALLRTSFVVPAEVVRARLHATAGGLYDLWLNGARVGNDRLAPGWTDYPHRVRARTHDVTALLAPGRNALGVVVMDGWYAGYVGWDRLREHYGRTPVAKVELLVDLVDGTVVRVASGPHWRSREGPIRAGDLLGGELYDARYEAPGWTEPAFDDSGWDLAWPDRGPAGQIVATPCEPVRVVDEVPPVTVRPGLPGSRVVDLGEEVVGWPRLTVDAAPGTVVRLRCAEAVDADGELWTANLRAAACTDTYVVGAEGPQVWEPRSTYRGFRYVEVTGPGSVVGVVAHSDLRETGTFACSSRDLTELWAAVRRTVRANLVSLPTDCPQRDERLGWLADAEVTLATASYLYDVGDLYAGWLADVRSGQSPDGAFPDVAPRLAHTDDGAPGWGDAGVAVPWALWEWYADRVVLEENLEAMARWPQWVAAANPDGLWRHRRGRDYGDWLGTVETPKQLLATQWWARACDLVARAAAVLDREDVRRPAADLGARVRASLAREPRPLTQTGLLLSLAFGLARDPEAAQARLVRDVEARGITTGFQGVRHLLPQLTAAGRTDLAYALALREEQPGWLAMLRMGATSIWERWDGRTTPAPPPATPAAWATPAARATPATPATRATPATPATRAPTTPAIAAVDHRGSTGDSAVENPSETSVIYREEGAQTAASAGPASGAGFADPFLNSFCHGALGTVAEWLHTTVGGLTRDPSVVGWRRALVAPEPGGGVTSAHTSYDARLGTYAVGWELAGDVLSVEVEVPVGGEAAVRLPGELIGAVGGLRTNQGRTTGLLASGRTTVRVRQESGVVRRMSPG